MKNWRTAGKAARRRFWKSKGHTHIRFNIGAWTHTPDNYGMTHHIPFEREQPRAYRFYP